jgi:hypothetical protein
LLRMGVSYLDPPYLTSLQDSFIPNPKPVYPGGCG